MNNFKKFFIKHQGAVREVVVMGVKLQRVDGELQMTSVRVTHQGRDLGWIKNNLYTDQTCQEKCSNPRKLGLQIYDKVGKASNIPNEDKECLVRGVGGSKEVVGLYPTFICYDEDGTVEVRYRRKDDGEAKEIGKDEVYFYSIDFDYFEETTIIYDNGEVETVGGEVKRFAFSDKQDELAKRFLDLLKEMNANGLRLAADWEDWEVKIVKTDVENCEVAQMNYEQTISGFEDEDFVADGWKEVPYQSFRYLPKDDLFLLSGDDKLVYRNKK